MPKPRFAVAVLLAIGLAIPANAQPPRQPRFQPIEPARPADRTLAVVPTDAFLFVSVKVSKLWDNPAAKPVRDWFAAQKVEPLNEMVGLRPAEIDRVTVFKASWDPDEDGGPLVLISTRKPYNEVTVLKALPIAKAGLQPWRRTPGRVVELEGSMRWVVFLDDRTLLFIPRIDGKTAGPNLLAQLIARKPDGPLATALAAAADHDFTVGIDIRGVEEFATLIQADKNKQITPFISLLRAKTAMLTADFDKTAKVQATLTFADAATAKRAAPVLEEGIKTFADFLTIDKTQSSFTGPEEKVMIGWAVTVLKNAKVMAAGANVLATADVPYADDLAKLVTALPKQFGVARDNATATNNLKQLGLAIHSFHDSYGFSPGDVFGGGQKPPAWSWRVQILPFIEQGNLYNQLQTNLPWDDPVNLKVLEAAEMPKVFEIPGRPAPKGQTYFRIFTMPKDAKGKDRPWLKEGERGPTMAAVSAADGTSLTFMVVEAGEAVPWYKPDVLAYDGKLPLPQLGAKDADQFLALFGDGSVRSFKPSKLGERTIRALITPFGGEVIELPK